MKKKYVALEWNNLEAVAVRTVSIFICKKERGNI
ncbi:hypothetical protein T479_09550 [Lysinibacillus varians]|nr:hypothetical protein T479_09550 [Lysinibacillus varians]